MTQEHVEIEIDLAVLARRLIKNPAFIAAIAKEIRIAQTKQVRSMGNLYGHAAQQQKPAPTTKRRLR
jgi:uncharacterized protein (DUF305 family)